MTDYSKQSDEELRIASAEMMGWTYSEEPPVSHTIQRGKLEAGKEFASYSWPINRNGSVSERLLCDSMPAKDWNPCNDYNHAMMLVAYGYDHVEDFKYKLMIQLSILGVEDVLKASAKQLTIAALTAMKEIG